MTMTKIYRVQMNSKGMPNFATAVEVADRPQGEWIYCEDDDGQDGYRCSECGFFVPWYYDYEDSNYILDYKACPHCLARMKGADDERG